MVAVRPLKRAAILVLLGAGTAVWYACADRAPDSLSGPRAAPQHHAAPDLRAAIAAQRRHTDALLDIPGVVGTAITRLPDGRGFAGTSGNTWSATVEIAVHDHRHDPLSGVTVSGSWGGANTGECTTAATGSKATCSIVLSDIPNATRLVAFAVSGMTRSGYIYTPSANHDPDGSSNGTTVFVRRQ